MAQFIRNQPIVQRDPAIVVDPAGLALGHHRFRLVVVDDSGNESAPALLDVIVKDQEKPTAILDMIDANGARIDPVATAGKPFRLSGARSADVPPGRIAEFRFTLVDP